MSGKFLLFSHIPNLFAVNILSKMRKIPSLVFYKLFLSDERQDFDNFLAFFNGFWDMLSAALQLTSTVFSK